MKTRRKIKLHYRIIWKVHIVYTDDYVSDISLWYLFSALAGSLALFGQGLFSPLVARMYNRVGPRTTTLIGVIICSGALVVTSQGSNMYVILVTYGGFFGFGSCFVFFPTYLVIPSYFVKRRSLALGLLAMGPGGGLFVISAIVEALLNVLHWRWTFMVLAGLVVFIIPLVCTIRRVPNMEEQSVNNNVEQKGTCCERTFSPFRNKRFDVITLSMSLYYAVHYIPLVHMVGVFNTIFSFWLACTIRNSN